MPAAAPKPLWPTSGHRSSARGDAGKASPYRRSQATEGHRSASDAIV